MEIRLGLIELSNPDPGGDGRDRNGSLVGTRLVSMQSHIYVEGAVTRRQRLGLKARENVGTFPP